jgi:glycerol uptake facilitator-like aquaporin
VVLILTLGPISGAHLNPIVTVAAAATPTRAIPWREVPALTAAQLLGALCGTALANAMFEEPLLVASEHVRSGSALLLSESVATFGLLTVILGCARRAPDRLPWPVGLYITAAYWFTASTSFANPAVTLARTMTSTFAGIRPADALPFIGGQIAGAVLAVVVARWLDPADGEARSALRSAP